MKIRNYEALANHGCTESRKIVLDIAEKTLQQLDSYRRIRSMTRLDGDILTIGTKSWDLSKKRHVYLIGAGKACNHMARAIDEILGDRLTRGIAIVKIREDTDIFNRTELYTGGHPLPNEDGYRACLKILELVDSAGPEDLFIVVISGGSSALMSCPREGITLQDEIDTTDVMLKSGAGIYEVNAVRRHISALNGGMLAKRIRDRGAELIGIGISDAVGNAPTTDPGIPYKKYTSTPMGPDATTLEDARNAIRKYDVADRLPKRVVDFLMNAGPEYETPKAFPENTYYRINTLPDSCIAAKRIAEELGLRAYILTSFLEGEASEAGRVMASLAREVQTCGNPFPAPCVLLSSGEVTVRITDNALIRGHGGPSHEMMTGFALAAARIPGACMLSIDSEGTDGTTPAAGALTDSETSAAAAAKGIDLMQALREHSCHEALLPAGDVVMTGNTGTNLCDLNILYVPAAPGPEETGSTPPAHNEQDTAGKENK